MTCSCSVLVVDDDSEIRKLLARYMREQGFRVLLAANCAEVRDRIVTNQIDLMILDVMLPDGSGLDLCRELRASGWNVPIILLTALKEDVDRIIGLEIGADDYLTKPFNPRELLARIKAVLRRVNSLPPQRDKLKARTIRFDRWLLNVGRRELVNSAGVGVPLSTAEFRLLHVFLDHRGLVLSREQLLDLTVGKAADVFDRRIDNQVSRLRKKIEADPRNPVLIKTHWGGGYSFEGEICAP